MAAATKLFQFRPKSLPITTTTYHSPTSLHLFSSSSTNHDPDSNPFSNPTPPSPPPQSQSPHSSFTGDIKASLKQREQQRNQSSANMMSFNVIRESLSQINPSPMDKRSDRIPMYLSKFKHSLNMRTTDSISKPFPNVIGGSDNLPLSVFGAEIKANEDDGSSDESSDGRMRTEFLKMEERESKSRYVGGVSFNDLRQGLSTLHEAKDDKAKKNTLQRLDILGNLGRTSGYMSSPPNEVLVEKHFHPDNMSASEKLKLELSKVRDEFKMSESDCGSARVQVSSIEDLMGDLPTFSPPNKTLKEGTTKETNLLTEGPGATPEPKTKTVNATFSSAKRKRKSYPHGKRKSLKTADEVIGKRKPSNDQSVSNKKPRVSEVEEEVDLKGPSLLGDVFIPPLKVAEGEITYPRSSYRSDPQMGVNDRLTVDTAFNFAYYTLPPRDRKMLRRADTSSLHERLVLGASQLMGLAAEVVDRSDGASDEVDKLTSQKEADQIEIDALRSSLEVEQKLTADLTRESELLKDDLKAARASNEELAARVAFLEGEGSSSIISNFLASEEGKKVLAKLCAPARNLGYHRALEALSSKCPEVDITSEKGYNPKSEEALTQAFDNLKRVKVDGHPYVPSTSNEEEKS